MECGKGEFTTSEPKDRTILNELPKIYVCSERDPE